MQSAAAAVEAILILFLIIAFIGIRNVGFPLLFLAVVPLLNLSRDLGFLLLLQAAMPPVTAAPILVGRHGGNVAFANQLLLTSYVASAVTIPCMVWLFTRLAGA